MHARINEKVRKLLESHEYRIEVKLGQILAKRGMTQAELSELTGIRTATINDIVNNRRDTWNQHHLVAIMIALKLEKLSDLIDITVKTK